MSTNTVEHRTQHTPGPWRVRTDGNIGSSWSEAAIVENEDGMELAQCGFAQNRIATANACLIAAAPELLEALRECLVYDCKKTSNPTRQLALKAIAKAEGTNL